MEDDEFKVVEGEGLSKEVWLLKISTTWGLSLG